MKSPNCFIHIAAFVALWAPHAHAQILSDMEPNIEDPRLHAWYDGDFAIGADGVAETPVWPNRQGDPSRDVANGFGADGFTLAPVEMDNGHSALRFDNVVTWANEEDWGLLDGGFTIFIAATVRDIEKAFFFTGNQGGGGAEVNAGFNSDMGTWGLKGDGGVAVETVEVIQDQLVIHAFTFLNDGIGVHHRYGEFVGAGETETASLGGFVLGGRQNGHERASVDFAEVLIYNEELGDEDRIAIETYLSEKHFPIVVDTFCDLVGDFNGSGDCDVADLDMLMYSGIAAGDVSFDVNGDGQIDLDDRNHWLSEVGTEEIGRPYLPGDADLSGTVDAEDLNKIGLSWLIEGATSWSQGDFNADNTVDAQDLNDVGRNWQSGVEAASTAAVPEPSGFLLLMSALALLGFRRSRNH